MADSFQCMTKPNTIKKKNKNKKKINKKNKKRLVDLVSQIFETYIHKIFQINLKSKQKRKNTCNVYNK